MVVSVSVIGLNLFVSTAADGFVFIIPFVLVQNNDQIIQVRFSRDSISGQEGILRSIVLLKQEQPLLSAVACHI